MINKINGIEKRGNSYRLIVYSGYTLEGKQIKHTRTWKPDRNYTEKQLVKELIKQRTLFEEEVKSGKFTDKKIKFQQLSEEWFNQEEITRNMKELSLNRLKGCRERVYKEFGHLYIHEICTRQIQKFINNLAKTGTNKRTGGALSTKSQAHHLNLISDVFNYAIKCGIVTDNPCRNVNTVKIPPKEREVFTLEEAQEFLNVLIEEAPPKYKIFFLLAIFGGFRRGELLGFEWKDIDFETGVITVNRTSLYKNGKMEVDTPKSHKSYRSIKLNKAVIQELKRYKDFQDKEKIKVGDLWKETDRLFTTWDGSPMSGNTPLNWLNKFCEAHNFRKVCIHSQRHLFASVIISDGTDPRTAADILGHSQTSTTLNIYAHSFEEEKAKRVEAVGSAFILK